MGLTVSDRCDSYRRLWEMISDTVREFLGDDHGVYCMGDWLEWLVDHADALLFGYVDGELAACTYLCGAESNNCAAIHTFVHPDFRKPNVTIPLGKLHIQRYFSEYNFRRLEGVVAEYNRPARLLCKRLGFTEDGRYRKDIRYNGKWYDSVFYSILRGESYGL